jgi:hypothetical protein
MSDFNPLDRAKIAVHRSSFDLSSKKLFTAKIGEILPCYWQIAIPGKERIYDMGGVDLTTIPLKLYSRPLTTESIFCSICA